MSTHYNKLIRYFIIKIMIYFQIYVEKIISSEKNLEKPRPRFAVSIIDTFNTGVNDDLDGFVAGPPRV